MEETVKKSFIIVSIIFSLVILGCTLPIDTSQKRNEEPPAKTESDDSEEKEKLKEKIAELEKEKLEEKIDNLEKTVEEQKKQLSRKNVPKPAPKTKTKRAPKGYVRVNSPGDGWLALRTAPNSKTGRLIMKIPHGTLLNVYGCTGVRPSGKLRGRWCKTVYANYEGWVFDYYLVK